MDKSDVWVDSEGLDAGRSEATARSWRGNRRTLQGHFSPARTLTLEIDGADSQSVNMLNTYLCSAATEKKWRRKDEVVTAVNKAEKQAACLLRHKASINYTKTKRSGEKPTHAW